MKNDLVSIIIPVYNTVEFLENSVNSVLGQTYKDIELWLVDDGSTDGSESLCDELARKDDRVKVIHKENEGQGVARNCALDLCNGEYIAFADSDDIIKPNMIECMVNAIKENDADIALCGIAVNNGIRLHDMPVFDKAVCWDTKQLMKEYVTTSDIHTGPCNKIYKRTLFDGIRFPDFRAHEDAYIMHLILGKCKKAVHVGECLYIQNIRVNSTEQSPFSEKKLALLDCAQSLIDYYKSDFPELYNFVAYKKINDSAVLLASVIQGDYKRYKNVYDTIYKQMKSDYFELSKEISPKGLISEQANMAVFKPNLFVFKVKLNKLKKRLKLFVKSVLVRLRKG